MAYLLWDVFLTWVPSTSFDVNFSGAPSDYTQGTDICASTGNMLVKAILEPLQEPLEEQSLPFPIQSCVSYASL